VPPESFFSCCRKSPRIAAIVIIVLATHGILAFSTARYCSVTHDEYWHIPVGLLNLQHRQFDYDDLNPPLGRMVAAFPLLFLANSRHDATGDSNHAGPKPGKTLTDYGDDFLAEQDDRYQSLIVAARIPTVILSVLFAFVAATFATELFGSKSGLAALILWSFSPAMISNAALATNDSFVSGMFLVAFWRAWRLGQFWSRRDVGYLGASIGIACLVKFTGVLLFALAPVTVLISAIIAHQNSAVRQTIYRTIAFVMIAVLVINAGYLFQGTGATLKSYSFQSSALQSIQKTFSVVGSLPVLVPYSFVTGIDHQKMMLESAHPVFLNRERSEDGFRSYYFYVLAWKLPHAFQVLFLLTMWTWFRGRRLKATNTGSLAGTAISGKFLALLLPTAVLLTIGTFSGMQLGLRYVLPAMPLLFVCVSQSISSPWLNRSKLMTFSAWGIVICSIAAVRFHPHHIAYFNELAGGPDNGINLLSDSNIDWGQDLIALKQYLNKHPEIENIRLAYFGTFPPGELGIQYELPSRTPEPGWYVLSVNIIQGRPNPLRRQDGSTDNTSIDPFSYIRFFRPVATIGKSIRVYHIDEQGIADLATAVRRAKVEMQMQSRRKDY